MNIIYVPWTFKIEVEMASKFFFNPVHRNVSGARHKTDIDVLCRKKLKIVVNERLLVSQLIVYAFNDRF